MKLKLILMCAMAAILLSLCACSSATSVDVSCSDFIKLLHVSKEAKVVVGDSLTVTLCSNPTTGFQWESAQISDQAVLQQTDHKLVMPEHKGDMPPPPGTPGQEVWTFKALKEGKSTISIEYSQSWEGGMKATWTFIATVTVK